MERDNPGARFVKANTDQVIWRPPCPVWARWWAVDANGESYYHERLPAADGLRKGWLGGGRLAFSEHLPPPVDWENELYRREEK